MLVRGSGAVLLVRLVRRANRRGEHHYAHAGEHYRVTSHSGFCGRFLPLPAVTRTVGPACCRRDSRSVRSVLPIDHRCCWNAHDVAPVFPLRRQSRALRREFVARTAPGEMPVDRLKARLKAANEP